MNDKAISELDSIVAFFATRHCHNSGLFCGIRLISIWEAACRYGCRLLCLFSRVSSFQAQLIAFWRTRSDGRRPSRSRRGPA